MIWQIALLALIGLSLIVNWYEDVKKDDVSGAIASTVGTGVLFVLILLSGGFSHIF